MQFAIEWLYCWQLLHTAWQQRKKHVTLKSVKHIVNIFLSDGEATQTSRDMGELYHLLDGLVDQHFVRTSSIAVVSRYSIPDMVSLSWLQFQVSHNTSPYNKTEFTQISVQFTSATVYTPHQFDLRDRTVQHHQSFRLVGFYLNSRQRTNVWLHTRLLFLDQPTCLWWVVCRLVHWTNIVSVDICRRFGWISRWNYDRFAFRLNVNDIFVAWMVLLAQHKHIQGVP